MEPRFAPGDALIVVDVQNDFLPGGSLPVAAGKEVVPVLNRWLEAAAALGVPVFATRDWHPLNHCSFRRRGGPWPPHCIAGSAGADFAPALRLPAGTTVISKATDPDREAYSGFDGTDLDERLRALGVRRLVIGGLATDYCVLRTVMDGLARGYDVALIEEGMRAVDAHVGDGKHALAAMKRQGALLLAGA